MDPEPSSPRPRPRPWLLILAALAVAGAIVLVLRTKMPGQSYTVLQAGEVRVLGHQRVVWTLRTNCVSCHR